MTSPYLDQPIRSELQACLDRLEDADRHSAGTPEDLEVIGDRCLDLLGAVAVKLSHVLSASGAPKLGPDVKHEIDTIRDWLKDELPDVVEDYRANLETMYRAQQRAAE